MPIIIIAACAGKKRVIGDNGRLPWHYSSDLKFFKAKTLGHYIIMGRVTYDSIISQFGRPLPGRKHFIITHNRAYKADGADIFHDLDTALAAVPKANDVYVAGGQRIYELALPHADRVLLTQIEKEYSGDAFFPLLDPAFWELVDEKTTREHGDSLRFCDYLRINRKS